MANSTTTVMRAIRGVLRDTPAASDRELLRRYVEEGDQLAFTDLVRRHAGMVMGVCRRALSGQHDAEDACQATFLVLVRQARSQAWQPSVANWLYTTARKVAHNARVSAQRRTRREGRAAVPEAVPAVDPITGRELLGALDEELDRLPARYREPLVLCYLEGLTRDEAAGRLGVPPATLKSQLERGRKKLADALARRGVGLGAGLAALAVSSPVGASPPRLVEAILALASGTAPAAIAALARGSTMNMVLHKTLGVLVAAVAVVCLGVAAWGARPAADKSGPAKADRASPQAKPGENADARTITGSVLDPEGKPVAGAVIVLAAWESSDKTTVTELTRTGADGSFRCVVLALPKGRSEGRELVARANGFAADWVGVRSTSPDKPVVLRLARATVPVRGRVLTLEGQPVPKAVVRVWRVQAPDGKNTLKQVYEKWAASPNEGASLLQKHLFYPAAAGLPEKVTTDANGRFEVRGVGDGRLLALEFSGETIETVIARVAIDPAFDPKAVRFDPKKADPSSPYVRTGPPLYGASFDHFARPCRVITGTVFDQITKKPVANVGVTGRLVSGWWEVSVHTQTDAAGRYRLVGMPNGKCELTFGTVKPLTYLWLSRTVGPTPGQAQATLDMPMVQGTVVTGRITDQTTSKPIKGSIRYATLAGNKHLLELPGKEIHGDGTMTHDLDSDGRFRFVAPPGLGIIIVRSASWSGDERPYPRARIRPEDRDKPYLRNRQGLGESYSTSQGILHSLSGEHAYRVIEPAPGAKTLSVDVQLDPGKDVAGKVVAPDGKPFEGATVAGLAAGFERPTTLTGDAFTVQALLPDDERTVAAVHAGKKLAGTIVIRGSEKPDPVVRLAPWGAVTGRVVDGEAKPVVGAQVRLSFIDRAVSGLYGQLMEGKTVTTDAAGRFRCDVPFAGVKFNLSLYRQGKYLETDRPQRGLSVEAGKTTALGDIKVKEGE